MNRHGTQPHPLLTALACPHPACLPFVLIREIRVSNRRLIQQHSSSDVLTCLNLSSFVLTFSSKTISLAPSRNAPTHCHFGCCKHSHSRFFRTHEVSVNRAISVIPVHAALSSHRNSLPILVPLCGHNIRVHLRPSVAKIVSPKVSLNYAKFHLITPTNTLKKLPINRLNSCKSHTSLHLHTSNTPKSTTFLRRSKRGQTKVETGSNHNMVHLWGAEHCSRRHSLRIADQLTFLRLTLSHLHYILCNGRCIMACGCLERDFEIARCSLKYRR
jgi:hypothetical protein